jgi:hypothetical protein
MVKAGMFYVEIIDGTRCITGDRKGGEILTSVTMWFYQMLRSWFYLQPGSSSDPTLKSRTGSTGAEQSKKQGINKRR